jgi:hypothetical protein
MALPDGRQLYRRRRSLGIEGGKFVAAIRAERERIDLRDRLQIEIAIEMRKQLSPTRGLPFEPVAERGSIHAQQHEIALAGEMFRRGLGRLFGAGEMNEAVLVIDRRTAEYAFAFGLAPERCGQIL